MSLIGPAPNPSPPASLTPKTPSKENSDANGSLPNSDPVEPNPVEPNGSSLLNCAKASVLARAINPSADTLINSFFMCKNEFILHSPNLVSMFYG